MKQSHHKPPVPSSDELPDAYSQKVLVLASKTYKPRLRKEFVKRQALIDRLEAGVSFPLALISAATGCGKSVMASQWLDETGHRYGWLSLDAEHNDRQVFLAYLVAILKRVWPQLTFGLENLLQGSNLPSGLIASTFINDLDQLKELFVLVLDDYQMIREEGIHEIINDILRYPPEHFHLVILTRRDPPLKLARLRAQFRLNEVRMKDLAFTIGEAVELRALLAANTQIDLVKPLVREAEGWVTGITVGLMSLAEGVELNRVLQSMGSRNSVISNLFEEVVIQGLTTATRKYLVLSSLLDRFSPELIAAMARSIGDEDMSPLESEEFINQSIRRNLFLIPLDSTGQWYRYHHFFGSHIRKRVSEYFSEGAVDVLYKAASGWFEQKELLEEALIYALQSQDMAFAVSLFSRFRHKLLNSEQLHRLVRLTNQFPEDVRNNNPELLINLAMLQHYNANFLGMQNYLLRAERLLIGLTGRDNYEKGLIGEYHAVSTYLSYMLGDFEKAIEHGEKSMEFLPADIPNFFREQAAGWYAFAQQACGDALAGMDKLESEYRTLGNADPYFQMRLLQGKLIFYLFEGITAHLYNVGSSLANLCSPTTYPGSWVIGIYSMTYHSYISNHLEKVSEFHDELRKYRFASRPFWVMNHFFVECLSGMARALWQKVDHCIEECEEFAEELGMEPLKGMVKAFQVEYYLRCNNVDRAREVSVFANFEPQPPVFFYYIPQLTQVKLLFQTQQKERGRVLLQDLLELGRSRHNKNLLMQALAFQAVIHFRHERKEQAKSALNEALKIVESKGILRPFLDHGRTMHHLLRDIAIDQPGNAQILELLHAFDNESRSSFESGSDITQAKENQEIMLSKRELEILTQVSHGYKNIEIAENLFISLDTVKKHLYRSFQKLDVKNRIGAIKKASELGLIASE